MNGTRNRKNGKVKVQRSVRIGEPVNGARNMVITDSMGVPLSYTLREIPVDFGRGFQIDKIGQTDDGPYHVHLDAELGDSCTCKGFVYGSKCKHRDAVKTLVAMGIL